MKFPFYKYWTCLFFCCALFNSSAQEKNEWLYKWKNPSLRDTTRINAALELSKLYFNIDLDSANYFAQEALHLSTKIKDDRLASYSYTTLAIVSQYQGELEQAIRYGLKAMALLKKIGDEENEARSMSVVGESLLLKGDFKQAMYWYEKSLAIKKKFGDQESIGKAYQAIANAFNQQGIYRESIDYQLKALYCFEKINLEKGIANCYNNIGISYDMMGQYDLSLNYFIRGMNIREKLGDQDALAGSYSNMATCYKNRKEYAQSLHYFKKALAIDHLVGYKWGEASTLSEMGALYDEIDSVQQAYAHYMRSLDLYREMNTAVEQARLHNYLGTHYLLQKNYAQAIHFASLAAATAEEKHNSEIAKKSYSTLYQAYQGQGEYRQAFQYLDRYVGVKDSVLNEEKLREITRLETRYEYEKKRATDSTHYHGEIALLQSQGKLQQTRIKNTNLLVIGLLVLVVLLITMAGLIIQRNRLKARQRAMELEQQALRARMNPHFLFNALNSIQTMFMRNDHETANEYLNNFARLIRSTLDITGQSTISLEKEIETLNLYLSLEQARLEHGLDYTITVAPDIDQSQVQLPPMIIQPFIENAVWHGLSPLDKKGKVEVRFFRSGENMVCEITDNGIGLTQSRNRKAGSKHVSRGIELNQKRLSNKGAITLEEMVNDQQEITGTRVTIQFRQA